MKTIYQLEIGYVLEDDTDYVMKQIQYLDLELARKEGKRHLKGNKDNYYIIYAYDVELSDLEVERIKKYGYTDDVETTYSENEILEQSRVQRNKNFEYVGMV